MHLQLDQLSHHRGDRTLFRGLSLTVAPGEALWLRGANGVGKSSLLRLLAGLGSPAEGSVRWGGQDIRRLGADYGRQLAYLGHAAAVKDELLGWENLLYAERWAGRACTRAQAVDALARLGLYDEAWLPTHALSQGQRRRLALARLFLPAVPPLWLLDEPFTALDQATQERLTAQADRHLQAGGSVVYTTHQPVRLAGRPLRQLELRPLPEARPA